MRAIVVFQRVGGTKLIGTDFRNRSIIEMRKKNGDRPVVDERTGERVRFLFYRCGVRISEAYLFQHGLKVACEWAGLVDGRGRATISAHRFRHTVGTQLAERGAKLHTIMSVLGHQSPHMAMVYARISDAEDSEGLSKRSWTRGLDSRARC